MPPSRILFDPSSHPLFSRLAELDLDRENFAIFGSAPLYARGMISQISDLDIIARGAAWNKARQLGTSAFGPLRSIPIIQFWGGKIEIFSEWLPRIWDTDFLIDQSEWLSGFRFVRLECVLTYKWVLNRPKDLVHMEQVRGCLAHQSASPRLGR
ncbi:hypothetical protein [Actinophytocola algeriensis]|uniref:Putative nucleotidyltransferase n=1 Tax=Actinophytocola algeriensis TaxID=1768010 RepID=A0A7W7VEC6_9PSEU|nr:hypothetical protein [Actinophytocola algeriensis]MBB4907092.1 putative nucleotidyltransferase [Actinophytocola algeriensis]MBE1478575.1 putative nucleotidyltransferase [Actinophytocola algeriensis]